MIFCSVEDNYFPLKRTLNINGKLIFMNNPLIFGIINCTPDSFFSESRKELESEQLKTVEEMVIAGVDCIDLGAYSTRPNAQDISIDAEIQRLIPSLRRIRTAFPDLLISVDTFRSEVAEIAIHEGASIINDVSMCSDPGMIPLLKKTRTPYILMHSRGTPSTMQNLTNYTNLFVDVYFELSSKLNELIKNGINDVILDLGYGFAKNREQNFELLKLQHHFKFLGQPILTGISRKSMIYKTLDTTPEKALNGTTVLNTVALLNGANILRVHDVKEAVEAKLLLQSLRE